MADELDKIHCPRRYRTDLCPDIGHEQPTIQGDYLRMETVERTILEALDSSEPLRILELADRVEIHPITVDRTCIHLHQEGQIYPIGHNLYQLTDCGRQRLDRETI